MIKTKRKRKTLHQGGKRQFWQRFKERERESSALASRRLQAR